MKKCFRDFQTVLRQNGYTCNRIKGSHYIYTNGNNTISVNKDLNPCVQSRLIKENALIV